MKQVKIQVARGENFTPNSLMYRYAKQTPGVTFEHGRFCTTFLRIDGKTYDYHHWSITAESGVGRLPLFPRFIITGVNVIDLLRCGAIPAIGFHVIGNRAAPLA